MEREANALYGPVLERRTKAAKIRVTLSILEQWKFFFNLASSLKEMVRKVIYQAWKKSNLIYIRDAMMLPSETTRKGKTLCNPAFNLKRTAKTRLE